MDEYVGDIRQRVLERMDLSREMSDEEIENLIGEEASRLMQEEPISIRERLMLEYLIHSENWMLCRNFWMIRKFPRSW